MEENEKKAMEAAKPVSGWRSATADAAAAEVVEAVEEATVETVEEASEVIEEAETAAEETAEAVEEAVADVAETEKPAEIPTQKAAEVIKEAATPKPKFKVKPWVWAIVAVVVIAIIGFAMFTMNQSQTYDQAVADFANGKYAEAAEGFQKLGNYQDSAEMYAKAAQWVDAQTAEDAAKNAEDADLWKAAAEAYSAIDDETAAMDAKRCNGNADYYTAKGMLAKSPTDRKTVTEALELFKNCTEIADADTQAAYCENVLDYYKAGDLAAEGKYYEAYKAYGKISKAAADKLGDVDKKRDACIQSLPSNGVVWRNSDAPSDSCQLTIVNSGNPNAYYKIYMADALTLTVFIAADESATFTLPSGTFSMNKAYGDTWFGTEDMFGDEGDYYICDFGGSKTFELESGGVYEISSGGQGTGIGSKSTNRGAI